MFCGQKEKEGAECCHAYALECVQEPELHFPLHIANKLHKLLYVRQWSGIVREALHMVSRPQSIGHPPGYCALEPLVTHCVQKNKMCQCTHNDLQNKIGLINKHALLFRNLFFAAFCHFGREPKAAPLQASLTHLVSEHDAHHRGSCTCKETTGVAICLFTFSSSSNKASNFTFLQVKQIGTIIFDVT